VRKRLLEEIELEYEKTGKFPKNLVPARADDKSDF